MVPMSWRFGTLTCMLCGTVAGIVREGVLQFSAQTKPVRTSRGLRCSRCNGGLYFERELNGMELPTAEQTTAAR